VRVSVFLSLSINGPISLRVECFGKDTEAMVSDTKQSCQ
jgi:hypothetical protein